MKLKGKGKTGKFAKHTVGHARRDFYQARSRKRICGVVSTPVLLIKRKPLRILIHNAGICLLVTATLKLAYNLGLNLFDAPDMGKGLFISREEEFQDMESILQPQVDSPHSVCGLPGAGYHSLNEVWHQQHSDTASQSGEASFVYLGQGVSDFGS